MVKTEVRSAVLVAGMMVFATVVLVAATAMIGISHVELMNQDRMESQKLHAEAPATPATPVHAVTPADLPAFQKVVRNTTHGKNPVTLSTKPETSGNLQQITCADVMRHWPGVLDFISRKLVSRFQTGSLGKSGFVCEAAWQQVLESPSLWIRGTQQGSYTTYVVQVFEVQHVHELGPDITTGKEGESDTFYHDRSIQADDVNKVAEVGVEPAETAAQKEEDLYGMRMLKRIHPDDGVALPSVVVEGVSNTAKWSSKLHRRFATLNMKEAKQLTASGRKLSAETKAILPRVHKPSSSMLAGLPENLDLRMHDLCGKNSKFPYTSKDQMQCGSCFAFASATVYSKRMCHASSGKEDIDLSPQDLVSCYNHHDHVAVDDDGDVSADGDGTPEDGCLGGDAISVWLNMQKRGNVVEQFNPYLGQGRETHPCGARNYDDPLLYRASSKIFFIDDDVETIKHELAARGPVVALMTTHQDFMSYAGGVYRVTDASPILGDHSVAIIGYGKSNGADYWLCVNSWGSAWGENGFFRIAHGEAGITQEVTALMVDPASDSKCSAAVDCMHGAYSDNCQCVCDEHWSTDPSGTCSRCADHCQNGGVLEDSDCSCKCPTGYFGRSCENYVLGSWKSVNFDKQLGEILVRWHLGPSYWKGAGRIQRYANLPAHRNPSVAGTGMEISSPSGSVVYEVDLLSYIPGYPENSFAFAMSLNLGNNEFGAFKGYTHIDLPIFKYDEMSKCLAGGNKIEHSSLQASKFICSQEPVLPEPKVESRSCRALVGCRISTQKCLGSSDLKVTCQGMYGPWRAYASHPYIEVTLTMPESSAYDLSDRCKTCYDLSLVE